MSKHYFAMIFRGGWLSAIVCLWASGCGFPDYQTPDSSDSGLAHDGDVDASMGSDASEASMDADVRADVDTMGGFEGGTCAVDRDCVLRAHSTVQCFGRTCAYSCESGFDDCDGDPSNGCETPLDTSVNCGRCGATCTNPNGATSCSAAACTPTCAAGFGDCDGDPTNGCEANLASDVAHCGTCSHACPTDTGTAICQLGKCVVGTCDPGRGDCDGNGDNGCETLLGTPSNCGGCGIACTNDHGSTSCQASSPQGQVGTSDAAPSDGGAPGICSPVCAPGFRDCDLNPNNGCETNINTDATNCGVCGHACPAAGGTPNCVAGNCGVSVCSAGLGDCDGQSANGCEVNLNTDVKNCGKCGHVCSSTNGTPSCNAGSCTITCNAGFGDCNANGVDGGPPPEDGCETTLNVVTDSNGNVANCGTCGNACLRRAFTNIDLTACAAGTCARICFSGQGDCDNNRNNPSCNGSNCGCETTLTDDVNNCGACGHVCKGGSCVNSTCECPDTQPTSGVTTCTLGASVTCGPYGACTCKCRSNVFVCTGPDGGPC